jgi:hypothetical protein
LLIIAFIFIVPLIVIIPLKELPGQTAPLSHTAGGRVLNMDPAAAAARFCLGA